MTRKEAERLAMEWFEKDTCPCSSPSCDIGRNSLATLLQRVARDAENNLLGWVEVGFSVRGGNGLAEMIKEIEGRAEARGRAAALCQEPSEPTNTGEGRGDE